MTYTIKFTFPVAKPLDVFYLMDEENFHVMPAHQLKASCTPSGARPTPSRLQGFRERPAAG